MLTRRDYKILAGILSELCDSCLENILPLIVDWLKFDNPRFDKTRFEIEITKRRQFGKTQISYSGKN